MNIPSNSTAMSIGLSDVGQSLLEALRPDGGASNAGSVCSKIDSTELEFGRVVVELEAAGLIIVDGKRIRRVVTAVSPQATMLLAALPADGSAVGNLRLRSKLQFDDATYAGAKKELVSAGLARGGVGYGGTLSRVDATGGVVSEQQALTANPGLVRLERDLYEPFADWLRASFAEDEGLFAHVKVTASERRGRGKWSEPDATAVRVIRHEWLPGVTVEVLSYELKRSGDSARLESVYEAAAHLRWAHWASLVIEQASPESEPADDVVSEVQRFGLGLYTMTRKKGHEFEIRQVVEPVRGDPRPENVNELLAQFFRRETSARAQYRALIG